MNPQKHGVVHANGLRFAYVEQGEGPLVLCLHGFPDTPATWAHLMPKLAAAGYRAVAPSTRGYFPTEIPKDNDYSGLQLGRDVVALIEALGQDSAIVIGHDWGAFAAYIAANLAPHKIKKLVAAAVPHPRAVKTTPRLLWSARHFLVFQARASAVRKLKRSDYVDLLCRRWSPHWKFSAAEMQPFKDLLKHPGVAEATLGYYWSFFADSFGARHKALRAVATRKTSVPTLCIVGGGEAAVKTGQIQRTPEAFLGTYSFDIFPHAGHFVHREEPELFAQKVLAFLARE